MTASVKIAEMKARLSELVAKAEAGEEVVIHRGDKPVAKLVPLDAAARSKAAFEELIALRDSGRIKPVTQEEIRAWKHEGHRY